jgi:hypothetical protein
MPSVICSAKSYQTTLIVLFSAATLTHGALLGVAAGYRLHNQGVETRPRIVYGLLHHPRVYHVSE